MSISRGAATALCAQFALFGLLALEPAARAQQAQEPAPEPSPNQPGARDLGQLPDDPARPGEPPPIVDPADPELDEVEESGLGSFFLTTFALGSAYDRTSRAESVTTPSPGTPGDSPVFDEEGEISYLVRPSFLFVHRPNARGGVVLGYEPELETFQDSDGEENVSHSAGVRFERRTSRRTDIAAGASYLDSLDPSRHLGGEGFVLVPGSFEQERVYFGASHLWPRATRLHFFSEYTSAVSDLDSDTTALDVTDVTGTLALEQGIGRRSDVTLSYSYTDSEVDTLDVGLGTPESFSGPVDAFRVGFGHRLDGGYSFHLSAGALREQATGEQTDLRQDDDISWIGAAEMARETDVLNFRVRYDRSLFSFGYGNSFAAETPSAIADPVGAGAVVRDTVADTVSFHLELLPQNRVRFEQSVWLSRQSVLEGDAIESFVTGSLVEVLLTGRSVHRLMLFSRLDYFDRSDSDLFGQDLSRTRFSLGFRVGLSGPQTKVGQQLALTELRKVLPSGGRL